MKSISFGDKTIYLDDDCDIIRITGDVLVIGNIKKVKEDAKRWKREDELNSERFIREGL